MQCAFNTDNIMTWSSLMADFYAMELYNNFLLNDKNLELTGC